MMLNLLCSNLSCQRKFWAKTENNSLVRILLFEFHLRSKIDLNQIFKLKRNLGQKLITFCNTIPMLKFKRALATCECNENLNCLNNEKMYGM